ncbi:MAG: 16S rRNA (cytidine(1402)-2'-O)-methyltransferase [Saccharofermentanales bacterium]
MIADRIAKFTDSAKGTLFVVGTSIGNYADMSARACEVLSDVATVAAEDTRRTGLLLSHLGIKKRMVSYHEHNKTSKGTYLLEELDNGRSIALVSDAGMPCISDPGYELVRLCGNHGIDVVVVPGPCAAVTALAGSGFEGSRFMFEGFIPVKGRERKERLAAIATYGFAVILYEAPHRVVKTLEDLAAQGLGARRITIARELTKTYEEFIRTTVDGAVRHFLKTEPRGEFVLVLDGEMQQKKHGSASFLRDSSEDESEDVQNLRQKLEERIEELLAAGNSAKDAASSIMKESGISRNKAYALVKKVKSAADI